MKCLSPGIHKLVYDIVTTISSGERLKALIKDPFYSNAIYLILANVANAVFGFVFWIIVARLYSPEDVGLASAVISAALFLAMLSSLGLGYGLIRFLQSSRNPVTLINSSFTIGGLLSVSAAVIFILGLSFWSPALLFIRGNLVYLVVFVLFIPVATLSGLSDSSFVAGRRAGFILVKNLILDILKLALPVFLAVFPHSFGIFGSWGIPIFTVLLVSLFWFLPRAHPGYHPLPAVDTKAVATILRFSFANYIADLLLSAPGYILPILVVNLLGAENNAYFFMAWAMSAILTMIPGTVSTSLFAEGSHDESKLGQNIRRSLKMVFLILTPVVILVLVLADKLLLFYGAHYSQTGATLLRLLAVSAFPLAINTIYFGIKRVAKKLKVIILLTILIGVLTIGLSYLLLPRIGITGAGLAWLVSQSSVTLVIVVTWLRRRIDIHGQARGFLPFGLY